MKTSAITISRGRYDLLISSSTILEAVAHASVKFKYSGTLTQFVEIMLKEYCVGVKIDAFGKDNAEDKEGVTLPLPLYDELIARESVLDSILLIDNDTEYKAWLEAFVKMLIKTQCDVEWPEEEEK